jgi:pyridoxal phosphate enzyme (YggS family)
MTSIAERVEALRKRIESAARNAGRDPANIRIVAVSKTFPAEHVLEAARCGLRSFGENRMQEAAEKIPVVNERVESSLEWHFVGRLQRNKAGRAAELFSVIESLDRPALAEALARAARARSRRIDVLLQVDLDDEPQKGGATPEALPGLLERVDALEELEPLGLMAIPRHRDDPEEMRPVFARLRELRDELDRGRPPERGLKVLSMGMTHDFEVAIEEGADWIRVGTAIFGERSRR